MRSVCMRTCQLDVSSVVLTEGQMTWERNRMISQPAKQAFSCIRIFNDLCHRTCSCNFFDVEASLARVLCTLYQEDCTVAYRAFWPFFNFCLGCVCWHGSWKHDCLNSRPRGPDQTKSDTSEWIWSLTCAVCELPRGMFCVLSWCTQRLHTQACLWTAKLMHDRKSIFIT